MIGSADKQTKEPPTMFKEYGELSAILYEYTKPVGRSIGGDIEYYSKKLRYVTGLILEAGVGTGRMIIPLIQQGLKVDGVEISPEMLAKCRANMEKCGVGAELYRQDLTEMSLPNKYDAIIMPTGSFCLLPKRLVSDVLVSFFKHLNLGGKIVIDLLLPTDFKKGETESYGYEMSDGTGILFTSFSEDIDWVTQKTSYIHRYELLRDGKILNTEISNFTLYWYGIYEFEMLLGSAGYSEIRHEIGYGTDIRSPVVTFTAVRETSS